MKFRLYWKKGAILLQTMVMSVVLCMISVMVLKWIMARYIIVARVQQSAKNIGTAQSYAMQNVTVSAWASNTPLRDASDDTKSKYDNVVHFTRQGTTDKYVTQVDDEY